jgi:hypothetical protein
MKIIPAMSLCPERSKSLKNLDARGDAQGFDIVRIMREGAAQIIEQVAGYPGNLQAVRQAFRICPMGKPSRWKMNSDSMTPASVWWARAQRGAVR